MEQIFSSKIMEHSGQLLSLTALMLLSYYPLLLFVSKVVRSLLVKIMRPGKLDYMAILKKYHVPFYLTHLFISIYLFFWGEIFEHAGLLSPLASHIKSTTLSIYATVFVAAILIALINIGTNIYKTKPISRKFPIIVHTHIIKIIIVCGAAVIIVSKVLAVSVVSLFTSIGAAAALLSFIFKDTLLGFVASLQLTFQDIVRVGDVINIPDLKVEGEVEMITISVVKIRNADQTITTIPTVSLLSGGLKNWRGMHEAGGRLIKRAINIDITTVKFCTREILSYVKECECMKNYIRRHPESFEEKKQITNLTLFRHYMNEYLRHHKDLHHKRFVVMVRYLDPTITGLPIEVHAFTKDTEAVEYEEVQANIFDHILAILPKFELTPYQSSYG